MANTEQVVAVAADFTNTLSVMFIALAVMSVLLNVLLLIGWSSLSHLCNEILLTWKFGLDQLERKIKILLKENAELEKENKRLKELLEAKAFCEKTSILQG